MGPDRHGRMLELVALPIDEPTRQNLALAEQELHDAVRAAREAGDPWTIVSAALDTTRHAARQRFGR
jgi:hypothetical protein